MDDQQITDLENLISNNRDLERLEDLLAEFNIFEVLGVQTREIRHSAFLSWLLDPTGNHGLGDYFLRKFLWQVTGRARTLGMATITALDVDSWNLSDATVETERHNIDILITNFTDEFVCVVENKVYSGEHSDQLRRYRETVNREYGQLTPIFVLLSIDGDPATKEDDASSYVPLSYSEVAELVQNTIDFRGTNLGNDVVSVLKQYVATLRRYVLSDSEIQRLAQQIYRKHHKAIDLIVDAKPDNLQTVRSIIESAIDASPKLSLDASSKSYIRCFDPRWDEFPQLKDGKGWTNSGRMLLLEFGNDIRGLSLRLSIGPGPHETRKALFDMATGSPKGFNTSRKKLPASWASIMSKRILSKQDHEDFDEDSIRVKIETALETFTKDRLDYVLGKLKSSLAG